MLGSDSACHTVEGLTDTECRLDVGGNLAIAATALFFFAAVAINCAFIAAIFAQAQDLDAQHEAEAGGEKAAAKADGEKVGDPEAGNESEEDA
jgi:hypothetical protein